MNRRTPTLPVLAARLLPALLPALLALPALAQDTPTEPADDETAAAPEAPVETKPLSGVWRGRHRVTVFGGYQYGNAVRDAGILAAPVTGQPGSRSYPAATPLRVELDDAPAFGLRYAWFAGDKWGIELGASHVSSEVVDPDTNPAADAAALETTGLLQTEKDALLARLAAHQAPHDMNVTFFDVSALHVFNPKKRWPIEIGGGLGWAFPSLDGPVAYERLVTSDVVRPSDRAVVANEYPGSDRYPDSPPAFGQCIEEFDPCIELQEQGGLTWNAYMTLGYAFTPNVQLRLGARARFVEQLVDPGDSNVMSEITLGLGFTFGGD